MGKLDAKLNTKQNITLKQALIFLSIVATYFIIVLLPRPAGLSPEGQKAIALMVCVILTWATQVVPILVSSVFFVFLSPVIGLNTEMGAVKDFAVPTMFFVLASIFLAMALDNCGLCNRMTLAIALLSKGKANIMVLVMLAGSALLSTGLSNISAFVAFLPIVLSLCKKNNCEHGKSNFAKASIIAIILGAMFGGIGMPAGSSMNIVAKTLLEEATGITISFGEWSMLAMPVVLICIPLIWLLLITIFKPEFKEMEGMDEIRQELKSLKGLNPQEIKFLILTVLMVIAWFTDKVHGISLITTAVIFSTIYFLPGIELIKPEQALKKVDWTVIIMTGASVAFATAMLNTGAAKWLADIALMPFVNLNPILLAIAISVFAVLLKILIPSCPAAIAIMVPILCAFAEESGMPVMLLFLPVAFTSTACWILPFDPLPMIIYPEKHFSIKDFAKAGAAAHAILIGVVVVVMLVVAKPLGYL